MFPSHLSIAEVGIPLATPAGIVQGHAGTHLEELQDREDLAALRERLSNRNHVQQRRVFGKRQGLAQQLRT